MKETSFYKEKLGEELAKLEGELSTLGIHDPKDPSNWEVTAPKMDIMLADANEAADATEEMQLDSDVLENLKVRYSNVLRALAKIEKGTYGVCEVDDGKIEDDRLEANPAARTCKEHIEDEEKLER